jgi:hypothetical protein
MNLYLCYILKDIALHIASIEKLVANIVSIIRVTVELFPYTIIFFKTV